MLSEYSDVDSQRVKDVTESILLHKYCYLKTILSVLLNESVEGFFFVCLFVSSLTLPYVVNSPHLSLSFCLPVSFLYPFLEFFKEWTLILARRAAIFLTVLSTLLWFKQDCLCSTINHCVHPIFENKCLLWK